jgi:hypothetical protein
MLSRSLPNWPQVIGVHRIAIVEGGFEKQVASVIANTAGVADSPARLMLIGLLALAMGGQNAVVRRLAVPDLTTTVLTLTVTGLVADTT